MDVTEWCLQAFKAFSPGFLLGMQGALSLVQRMTFSWHRRVCVAKMENVSRAEGHLKELEGQLLLH